MIRNLCILLALCLALSCQSDAQSRKHRVFDKKFIFVTALSVGVSIAATVAVSRCRHDHGIGPCVDGGYGEYKQREALRQGLTAFLIWPSYRIKQIEDSEGSEHSWWWTLQAANTALNIVPIAINARRHYGPRDRD